jgi:HD superfamily phosphohydrolase
MTARLLAVPTVSGLFQRLGGSINQEHVVRLLTGGQTPTEKLLHQIISGELDVDKMDYLLRDSLFCGVRYGSYDLERLLDTIMPLEDPETGAWSLGVGEGGVHALEALVMARYYMFTQVYFEVRGKVLELHLSEWLRETGTRWPSHPEVFLEEDDATVTARMRQSDTLHARAVLYRERYPLAFETDEHLSQAEKRRFEALLPGLEEQFGQGKLLVSNSAKDPHRFGSQRVLVRKYDGSLIPMEEASHFIRHLRRIDRYRVYAAPELQREAAEAFQAAWGKGVSGESP